MVIWHFDFPNSISSKSHNNPFTSTLSIFVINCFYGWTVLILMKYLIQKSYQHTLYSLNWTPILGHHLIMVAMGTKRPGTPLPLGAGCILTGAGQIVWSFLPRIIIMQASAAPRLRAKVQPKFRVYNKIMAIKLVRIEVSRFPDCSNVPPVRV